jgi:hypothetical protein
VKALATFGLLSLAFATVSPSSPREAPRAPLAEARAAPAPVPVPVPAPAIREIDGPLPKDLAFDVLPGGEGWLVRARHPKHLVALRRDDRRVAAAIEASLPVGSDAAPVVWETTDLASLATTRGVLHLDPREGGEPPALRPALSAPPASAARDERPLHRCEALHDGAGGFTVLCRVDRVAYADNLAGAERHENVVVVGGAGNKSVVRLDLPASQSPVDARVIGYASGNQGYVVRAEASFLPGEERPSFTISSAERRQPVVPPPIRYTCCYF